MKKNKTKYVPAEDPSTIELLEVARKYPTGSIESTNPALELKVNMGDIRTMAMVELRRSIVDARDAINRVINDKQQAVHDKSAKLVEIGNTVIGKYKLDKTVEDLVTAINAYRQKVGSQKDASDVYFARVFAPGTSMYGDLKKVVNATDNGPVIDADDKEIQGSLKILNVSVYNGHISELDLPIEIPFTPEMLAIVEEIHVLQTEITEHSVELSKVTRQLAELPHQGDIIQSMLTRAQLSGELRETSDILKVLEHGCKLLKLPEPSDSRKQLGHDKTTGSHT